MLREGDEEGSGNCERLGNASLLTDEHNDITIVFTELPAAMDIFMLVHPIQINRVGAIPL